MAGHQAVTSSERRGRMRASNVWVMVVWIVACLGASPFALAEERAPSESLAPEPPPGADKSVVEQVKSSDRNAALKAGEELYKRGEYFLALERLQTATAADPDNEEALMFLGLTQLRLNDPAKGSKAWAHLQEVTKQEPVRQHVGRMQEILLREISERAAKDAVAHERTLGGAASDP